MTRARPERPEQQSGHEAADASASGDRREHRRWKVLWWVQLDLLDERIACSIYDLSPGGARLRLPRAVETPQPVGLIMPPFGRFAGDIVWSNGDVAGIRFADAEQPRLLRIIASRLNQPPA